MKIVNTLLTILTLAAASYSSQAQSATAIENSEYQVPRNDAAHPCISDEMYTIIEQRCAQNIARLGLDHVGSQRSSAPVQLNWPLKIANGLNDNSFYIVSAYVDQDATSGTFKDWDCGTNTYDGHRGTDICTYPYPFYKMDHDLVDVVAAADGIIIDKHDGEFDKNCASNSSQANYVVIQHADGTFANYFHMKKNSLTSKAIGQSVVAGEFLGVVGSSGNANGPHLHFEVRTANNATAFKDPFAGGCNSLNSTSWWASQKPYTEPAVLKAQIGAQGPVLTSCPSTETPNDDACIAPGTSASIYVFLRNETPGLHLDVRLLGPTGAEITSWSQNSAASHLASIYGWTRTLPTVQGTYTLQTVYNGATSNRTFEITSGACAATTGVASLNALHDLQVYPNPTNDRVNISAEGLDNGNYTITLHNMLGQQVLSEEIKVDGSSLQKNISVSQLPDGMYFVSIEGQGATVVRKVEKRN